MAQPTSTTSRSTRLTIQRRFTNYEQKIVSMDKRSKSGHLRHLRSRGKLHIDLFLLPEARTKIETKLPLVVSIVPLSELNIHRKPFVH